jgi:hypothetical protein
MTLQQVSTLPAWASHMRARPPALQLRAAVGANAAVPKDAVFPRFERAGALHLALAEVRAAAGLSAVLGASCHSRRLL